jgi:hypothetical protein
VAINASQFFETRCDCSNLDFSRFRSSNVDHASLELNPALWPFTFISLVRFRPPRTPFSTRVHLADPARLLVYILSTPFSSLPSAGSPSSPVLKRFARLDGSSQDFPKRLCDLLCGDDYTKRVPGLQGDDLMWLVEYLDQLLHRITLLRPSSEPA